MPFLVFLFFGFVIYMEPEVLYYPVIIIIVGAILLLIFKSTTKKQKKEHKNIVSNQYDQQQSLKIVVKNQEIKAENRIILDVPKNKTEEAKSLGVKYDPIFKRQYISSKINTMPFQKWISEDKHIAPSVPLYLLSALRACPKCKNDVKVFCLASDGYTDLYTGYYHNRFVSYAYLKQVPLEVFNILKKEAPSYKKMNSKRLGYKYYMNQCSCGCPQGDNYLHQEEDSVFGNAKSAEFNKVFNGLGANNFALTISQNPSYSF